jgi:hypothetical protein
MKTITLFVCVLLFSTFEQINAQRTISSTNDHRRFALSIGMGRTQGFDRYEVIGEDHPNMSFFNPREVNVAFGFTWYHPDRWFTSLHWHVFNSMSGASASREVPATDSTGVSFRWTGRASSFVFNDYSLRVGRTSFARHSGWQASWMAGINFKHITHDASRISTEGILSPLLDVAHRSTTARASGFMPSLQAGYQVAYRGKRMGVSLMALGNYGLSYFAVDEYEVAINNERYRAAIHTKGDLIAWIVQYEVYFGNTSSRQ